MNATISSLFGADEEQNPEGQLKTKYQSLHPKQLTDASRDLPPELIKGILYQSRRMLLTGASKSKKSWMLHQMTHDIANGFPFLDTFETQCSRILYVNFELLEPVSSLRFDAIGKKLGGNQDNISIISVSNYLDLVGLDFSQYLALCAKELDNKAVVLDPMWRILGDHDENNNTEIRLALAPLVRFSREASASMIGAHHHTKGSPVQKEAIDRSSGAGAWHRDPAVIFTMTPHKTADAYTINIVGNDFPTIDPFVVRFEYPLFLMDRDLDPTELKQPPGTKEKTDQTAETMLAILRGADMEGGLSFNAWLKASGLSKTTFCRKLKELTRPYGPVIQSVSTSNYMLSAAYAQQWANGEEPQE
jgi:hypothetical protein